MDKRRPNRSRKRVGSVSQQQSPVSTLAVAHWQILLRQKISYNEMKSSWIVAATNISISKAASTSVVPGLKLLP
jgi:hypothetical protein